MITLKTLATTISGLLIATISFHTSAECTRWQNTVNNNAPPQFDGPGAFGELHNTLSLDCLTLTSVIISKKGNRAILVDEKGKSYTVRTGDYVGNHHGKLVAIHSSSIDIEQAHYQEETVQLIMVKLEISNTAETHSGLQKPASNSIKTLKALEQP